MEDTNSNKTDLVEDTKQTSGDSKDLEQNTEISKKPKRGRPKKPLTEAEKEHAYWQAFWR